MSASGLHTHNNTQPLSSSSHFKYPYTVASTRVQLFLRTSSESQHFIEKGLLRIVVNSNTEKVTMLLVYISVGLIKIKNLLAIWVSHVETCLSFFSIVIKFLIVLLLILCT